MKFKKYHRSKQYQINEYTKHKLSHLIGLRAIPLSEPMLDRLGYVFETKAYNVLNDKNLKELYKHQKSKSQISTFTKGGYELMRLPSQPNILCNLSGTAVMEADSDMWTLVDTQGRRWIDQHNRVKNNKMSFYINGYLQKILQDYIPDIEVEKLSTSDLTDEIQKLSSKDRSTVYKKYIDLIERYIDSGGYKDLSDYLKKSADLSYNEIVLTNYTIDLVRCIDFDSPHIIAEIDTLGLKYGGVISAKDLKKI